MKKEIIVNADDLESRIAILEDGQLAELLVEREARIVGSIFKAKVMSVLPGMDAAFADVGLERNVFLCADDVGFVSRDGVTTTRAPRSATISQRLKQKQEVVVQISRAPVAGKGARATTRLALPGRYLVLMISHGTQVGVSRKIEDRPERDRLRKIGGAIRPKECGIIIRTEAEGRTQAELETDLKVLLDLRDRIMKKAASAKAPALIHQDLTLVYQVIRDVFNEEVQQLVIDRPSVYEEAVELSKLIAPKLRRRIKRYKGKLPIFHDYDIEGEIDRLLRRKVWLESGGYISIDQAEAFTAIDVNTGRYTGSTGLEDTILRTNLQAAEEVARQLRLRDLGGIIVIDFIDMERERNRDRVVKTFQEALKRDRQRTKILHLSPLGLIEMTRKRRGESLMGILTETCPLCAGLGRIRRPLTVALKLEREAARLAREENAKALCLLAAPAVAALLIGDNGARAEQLAERTGTTVHIRAHYASGTEEHELRPCTQAEAESLAPAPPVGRELVLDRVDPPEPGGDHDRYGWAAGYRLLVDTDKTVEAGTIVVLTESSPSFGVAQLKEGESRRRRGRGGRRPREDHPGEPEAAKPAPAEVTTEAAPVDEHAPRSSRRRRRSRRPVGATPAPLETPAPDAVEAEVSPPAGETEQLATTPPSVSSRRKRRGRRRTKESPERVEEPVSETTPVEAVTPETPAAGDAPTSARRRRRPRRRSRRPSETAGGEADVLPSAAQTPSSKPVALEKPSSAPASPLPRRGLGLLRRGARRLAKVSKEPDEQRPE